MISKYSNIITIEYIEKWLVDNKKQLQLLPNQLYYSNKTKILFKCLKCFNIFSRNWNNLSRNTSNDCSICSGRKVVHGVNDLYTLRPDLVSYFIDIDTSKHVSTGSGKKVNLKCIHCGYNKSMVVYDLCNQGFRCNICSDFITIPNKFVYALIKQVDCNCELEYKINNRYYDIYSDKLKMTIEAHGEQHYKQSNRGRSLEEEQKNDSDKRKISELLGNIHVEIDCRKSKYNYLKEQCIKSLYKYINFDDINWLEIYSYCNNSLMVDACNMYNNGSTVTEIVKEIKKDRSTVIKYLKNGYDSGLCDYNISDINDSKRKQLKIFSTSRMKKVNQYSENGDFIKTWNSLTEITKHFKKTFSIYYIRNDRCFNGYKWKYEIT